MSSETMLSADLLSAEPPPQAWKYPGRYGPLSSALVRAGDRLIGVASGTVFAIDIHTGNPAPTDDPANPEWAIELTSRVPSAPHVTASGGAVYLMDGPKMLAFHLSNAKPLKDWKSPAGLTRASRLLARQDRVIAVHASGASEAVSGFDARTGARIFGPVKVAQNNAQSVTYGDGALFFVASGKLNAVNVNFPDPRWTFAGAGDTLDPTVEPLVADKVVVAAGKHLHAVSLDRGLEQFIVKASDPEARGFHWFAPVGHIPNAIAAATLAVNRPARRPLLGDAHGTRTMLSAAQSAKSGTAIASNTAGDLICFSLADGKIVWRKTLSNPGAPVLIEGVIYISTEGGESLSRFDATRGNAIGVPCKLPRLLAGMPVVIGNGALFLSHDDGSISGHPFAVNQAAYFDGKSSYIKVPSEGKQGSERGRFDFGTDDFTVEAWFRSTSGGEIVSSYPTNTDPHAHCFRLNLSETGQVCVAVFTRDGRSAIPGRTVGTFAIDGEWHHVAFVRREGNYVIVLDGLSHDVRLPDGAVNLPLSIGGDAALTIGAFASSSTATPMEFFRGLIREVRLWNRAVDTVTIAANRDAALTGLEPRLQGMWKLDEEQLPGHLVAPRNLASMRGTTADFVQAASRPTDFTLDRSAFPYLIHESNVQWPYAGTWGARGEQMATGASAASGNGFIAFSTTNSVYAVRAHDGARVWAMDARRGVSEPVSDGDSFLVVTADESVVRIDARTGGKAQLEAFAAMPLGAASSTVRPAVSGQWIAVCPPGEGANVYIAGRGATSSRAITVPGGNVRRLLAADTLLAVLSQSGDVRTVTVLKATEGTSRGSRTVYSPALCAGASSLFVAGETGVVKLDVHNPAGPAQATSAAIGGAITGLAASEPHDLLVVATSAGDVHGLSLSTLTARWKTTLPGRSGKAAGSVNPPILDADGRTLCTTSAGTIAALGAEDGVLQGLYFTRHGALATPLLRAGTLYTACLPTYANDIMDEVDGALHSIVLGETVALRLNLDELGRPIAGGQQHGVVEPDPDTSALHLVNMKSSCIEAWFNVPKLSATSTEKAGGGILGIAPTKDAGFGLNLWLDPDGKLRYKAHDRKAGVWTTTEMAASGSLADGKWHHVAVCRQPDGNAFLAIDGQQLNAAVKTTDEQPAAIGEGNLKAFLGARAGADFSPTQAFRGMIAEVRVWDAWLPLPEIAARMNVKLRGDEPDLIACWNFDSEEIHDAAHLGHDGDLAEDGSLPTWWLTDLAFTQPNYPHITSTAAITKETEGKASSYQVVVKVVGANGLGVPSQPVKLWYVRQDSDEPATVLINGTELEGVSSGRERRRLLRAAHQAKAYEGITGADGSLKLDVITSVPGHGPSLDVWTEFMPEHMRFHLNVLLDEQKLEKPAPPVLTAQAKLLQDYHYTTGGKIDDTRDRSTWRVIVRAAESSGRNRPNEPITLWSSESTTVEIGSKSYSLNPENSVTVDAQPSGELTLVMSAEALTAPTLYARAGFMHRNDRVVINPDQDAHAQLSTMKSSDLNVPRSTNWKRPEDRKAADEHSVLEGEYAQHAPEVADAVRKVATSVKPTDTEAPKRLLRGITPARRQVLKLRVRSGEEHARLLSVAENGVWSPPVISFMKPVKDVPPNDRVITRRTLVGMARPAPVDAAAFRDVMQGNVGFVFSTAGGKFSYKTLKTPAEALAARGVATVRPLHGSVQLGGFFDDMWDGIKDAANTIYDGVTDIVVTVANTIQLAITTMVDGIKDIVHTIVSSVSDALDAIAGFFEQLAVGIMKVIAFLRALFDWGNIIKTHDILFSIFKSSFDITTGLMHNTAPFLKAVAGIAGPMRAEDITAKSSLGAEGSAADQDDSAAQSSAKSVQGKSLQDRAQSSSVHTASDTGKAPEPQASQTNPFDAFIKGIPDLANSILDLSPSDLGRKLLDLLESAAVGTMMVTASSIATIIPQLSAPFEWVLNALSATIDIPFISELYKWITGRPLSLLSVICLALAIPVNLAYALITAVMGKPGFFFEEATEIATAMNAAAARMNGVTTLNADDPGKTSASDVPVVLPKANRAAEIALMVFKCIIALADMGLDYEFISRASSSEGAPDLKAFASIYRGIGGVITLSLQTFVSQPTFHARVKAVVKEKSGDFIQENEYITYTLYGILMALCIKKVYTAVQIIWSPADAAPMPDGNSAMDWVEFGITSAVSAFCAYFLVDQIVKLGTRKKEIEAYGNDEITEQYRLMAIRDILTTVGPIFEWMYTAIGAKAIRRMTLGSVEIMLYPAQAVRNATSIAGLALHGQAVFEHGGT